MDKMNFDAVLISMAADRIPPGVLSPAPGRAVFVSRKPFYMYDDEFLKLAGIVHRVDPVNNNTETHRWLWADFVFKTVIRGMNQK